MEHDIPFGNSNRGNGTTFLDFPLFLGIFQWDEPTKRVPFTAEREIPEILTKWKAPLDYLFKISVYAGNFPVGQTKKMFTIYIPTEISGNLWWMVNHQYVGLLNKCPLTKKYLKNMLLWQ